MARQRSPLALIAICLGLALAALLLAQARLVINHDGNFYPNSTTPVGADLLVFYGAGRIVADGDGAQLYDPARQSSEQIEILGIDRGLAIFPYPAFVAAPYAALAKLSLPRAYLVTTLAMLAATIGSLAMLRNVSPTVRARPILVGMTMLISQPFNMALLGGQTVAFSFLCLTGVYVGFRRERNLFLGFWLGLLLYKPQLAALPLLIVLWQRRWQALSVTAGIGVVLYGIGAWAAGFEWPRRFLELATGDYYRKNAIVADGLQSISIPSVTRYVTGSDHLWSNALAFILCLAVLAVIAPHWRTIGTSDAQFPLLFGATVAATILVSPHALFYEAGLLILPVIALIDRWESGVSHLRRVFRRRLLTVAALLCLGFLFPLAETVRIEPLFLAPVLIGGLCLHALRAPESKRHIVSHQRSAPLVPAPWD